MRVDLLKFFAFNNYGEGTLSRAIRVQVNLIKYSPIFLLLFNAGYNGPHPHIIYMIATIFLISRLMHEIAFGLMRHNSFLRFGGTFLTLISILIISTHNIYEFIY